ncbi:MAG: hypothetical protein P8X46_06870 [Nitrospirales bacterium]
MKALRLILIAASSVLLFTPAANAGNEVIGTIEATLDGKARTWYILKTDTVNKGGDSGAIWMQTDPDQARVIVGGFERKDVPFTKDAVTGMIAASGQGSQMSLTFKIPSGTKSMTYRKPEIGISLADVFLMTRIGDYASMHPLGEGQITVDRITLDDTENGRIAGSFEGTLIDRDGEPWGRVTDGRFEVNGVVPFRE